MMNRLLDKISVSQAENAPDVTPDDVTSALAPARREWGLDNLSLDGIVLLDNKQTVIDANPQALIFLHTSLTAISGYCLWDVVSQEIASQHEAAAELALSDADLYVFVANQSFENSWVQYTLRRVGSGFVLNLRETGSAQKYQRLLEESKRYNQLIFEANPNAMWVFDKTSHQIFAVNQAAIKFYGIARQAFMSLRMDALFPEGDAAELLNSLQTGNDGQSELRLCKQIKKGGKEVLVELAWSQVKWNGHHAVLVGLADISDRHIADAALKKSNAELQQALLAQQTELKSVRHDLLTFTQAVSSDLQDSLHVAQGFASRLAEKYSPVLDDQGIHYVRRIQASISQLARLVDDLRTLAQLPLGSGTPQWVDLGPICRSLLAGLRKLDPARDVTVEMDSSLMMVGNRGLLTTALFCLLENAWKFTARKTEAWIKVSLLPGKVAGELVLVVTDNGAGFDPVYSVNLFAAFQRLHSSADFPGNGLGLAIIKRVAQMHGGTVWAESRDQMGASFFMSLPQAEPDPSRT